MALHQAINRRPKQYCALAVWLLMVVLPCTVLAHEDLLARIALLTERLRTNGPSAAVIFERAEIYRLHQDWELALQDYASAATGGYTNGMELDLGRARTLVGWGKLTEARSVLDRVVALVSTNAHARLERARVLAQLNEPALAVMDYAEAIALEPNPRATDFLERAQLEAAVSGPAAALKGLNEGLTRLGWTLTLQVLAVDYEVAAGNYEAALVRLETILTRSARRENWLARKGEILRQAGRLTEARSALNAALEAINRLPPRLAAAEKTSALRAVVESGASAIDQELQTKSGAAAK